MRDHGLAAYIVPSADPHQTEYTHPHWRCRAWLSGFTGSVGTVAVLPDQAGLWADGRYFIQAERELEGSGIELFKMGVEGVPKLMRWVFDALPEGAVVGVDGRLITLAQARAWERQLDEKRIRLRVDLDLVAQLWTDRPAAPTAPAVLWPLRYAGRSAEDKLAEFRSNLRAAGADAGLVSSMYDVNWLLNLRGDDTQHTPLLTAHALIERDGATLFVDEAKISDAVRAALEAAGVGTAPYEAVGAALAALPGATTVYLCPEQVSAALRRAIECAVVEGKELTALPKARKGEVELKNWAGVHERDGVAMARFLRWLEEEAVAAGVDEVDAADRLEALRRSDANCRDLSFRSISGYGPNAAIIHYSPERGACAPLEPRGLYLIDSGGQYLGGTTDITRTVALGALTDEERKDYTLTLKGMINLSATRFLKGATGQQLDAVARRPLWEHGLDYKHGTGHGVGCYLNVHEGPHNLSPSPLSNTPLEPGMVVTIEPGIYKEGRHGIRIENMVVVEPDRETEFGVFYRFATMTLCPIDTAPLERSLLTTPEVEWLNAYHAEVRARLAPRMGAEEQAWLVQKTAPIA